MFQAVQIYPQWPNRSIVFWHQSSSYQKMGESRVSTTICHMLLAGSSVWTCRTLHRTGHIQWAYGTLGLYFAKSCIGAIKYGTEGAGGRSLEELYYFIEYSSICVGLPLYTTDLYLGYSYPSEGALIHVAVCLIPLAGVLYSGRPNPFAPTLGLVLLGCLVSTYVVGFVKDNLWIVGAAAWYMLIIGFKPNQMNDEVGSEALYSLGLCFYNYFMMLAQNEVPWSQHLSIL